MILRELDASVRAALAGDNVPLLRLAGQANTWSHTPAEADYFSRGAYLAVACLDYPQLFDLDASPERAAPSSPAQVAPNAFAPFTAARVGDGQRLHAALRRLPRLAAAVRRPPRVPARSSTCRS